MKFHHFTANRKGNYITLIMNEWLEDFRDIQYEVLDYIVGYKHRSRAIVNQLYQNQSFVEVDKNSKQKFLILTKAESTVVL